MSNADSQSGNAPKRRNEYTTMAEIILLIKNGYNKKTRIMQSANLPSDRSNKFLEYMEGEKLIEKKVENSATVYTTTSRADDFLERYNYLEEIFDKPISASFSSQFLVLNNKLNVHTKRKF